VSFGEIQSLLMLVMRLSLGVEADEGIATRFGDPGDPWMGGPMACLHREMLPDDMVCAHLWLPCGTPVLVTNLERPGQAVCIIGDRGPYGAKGRPWQAIIDLSPAMSKAIKLDGHDRVRLVYRVPRARLAERPSVPLWLEDARKRAKARRNAAGPDS
jgi:hypothetical protein